MTGCCHRWGLPCYLIAALNVCAGPSLDAVIELLALLPPILGAARTPPLACPRGQRRGCHPTSHCRCSSPGLRTICRDLAQAARLFDLFIASHPLMPLYAAVAVLEGD